jgi:long-chain acyl-CoA synthetase
MSEKKNHSTLIDAFLGNVEAMPDRRFMTQPMGGGGADCNVKYWTFAETLEETKKMAHYLSSLHLPPGSSIALCSKNCAWWIIADLAIQMAGHVTIPIYPTLTGDTVQYILEHSESKLLFIGKLDEHPWNEMKTGVSKDLPTVSFPLSPAAQGEHDGGGGSHQTWDEIIRSNQPPMDPIVSRKPEEMATIIYTSGSTGRPKGVMHDFETMYVTTVGICKLLKASDKDRYLSYLPLAHGMERWLGECVALYAGVELFFAESLSTFVQDLNRAKPTLFVSVPRLWTKFQQGVYKKMPPKKLNTLLKIPLLNILIKRKILKGLGLDQVRIAGSGSAPIPAELIAWYRSLGLELLEGYGMTENFNYSHLSLPGHSRAGYVGNAYPEVHVRIDDESGEIQIKGPGTMMGYYKNEEATKETITADGFLKTGDRGELDAQGRLKITGRTKELFKTSKGKYVAPAPIENKLINHPLVELACVGGASYPQPHAVVQLSEDARENAKDAEKRADMEKILTDHLNSVNSTLDGHEQLDFIVIVEEEWLPENGFLTPTQKIVRRKIEETYDPNNDTWYAAKKKIIWHGW